MTQAKTLTIERQYERLCELRHAIRQWKRATEAGSATIRFNMTCWYDEIVNDAATDLSCGTYACIGGYAATIPVFQAEGFTAFRGRDGDQIDMPFYDNSLGFTACRKFFGLTMFETEYIFGPEHYNSMHNLDEALQHLNQVINAICNETRGGNDN